MGDDPSLHPSRTAWPHMDRRPTGATRTVHDHRPPSWERRAIIGLAVGLLLCLVGLGVGGAYLWQRHAADQELLDYIEGRGEDRDREREQLQQELTDAVCDLLDQLPAGGLLERPRQKYGCGPGYPRGEIDPGQRQEQQDIIGSPPAPTATPERSTPRETRERIEERRERAPADPRPGSGAESTTEPPPAPEPSPEPERSPLDVVTEPVCDVLTICLEELVP